MRSSRLIIVPILVCIAFFSFQTAGAETPAAHYVLIDTESSIYVPEKVIKAADLGLPGGWSIEKRVLRGGLQDGVDVIILDNGRLTFTIVPTRGMSIWDVRCKETRLGWESPVDEIVHPNQVNLLLDDGLGWLYGFGAWLPRGGLHWFGNPGKDEVTGMFITLHGLVDYIPASRVEVEVETRPPYTLKVTGVIDEARLFRPTLRLVSEFSTKPDSLTFKINDTLTNKGGVDTEYGMLYHPDYGHPFLGEGSRLVAPFARITPQAKEGFPESSFEEIVTYKGPRAGYSMQVYLTKVYGDDQGMTRLMLKNKESDLGVSYHYSLHQLPYLTVWKNLVALEDGYVTGIEPGTAYPNHRNIERKNGRYPVLKPGASTSFQITFELAVGAVRVEQIENEIRSIQGGRETTVHSKGVEGISY